MSPLAMQSDLAEQRRALVRAHPRLKGLDRVEVAASRADRLDLDLHFLTSAHADKPAIPALAVTDVELHAPPSPSTSGPRAVRPSSLRTIGPTSVRAVFPPLARVLEGRSLPELVLELRARHDLDPLCRTAVFRLEPADAATGPVAPSAPPVESDVDYLARDYDGYRRLLLDQMARALPAWRERHPADAGVTVVEVLAYAADQLAYAQDAVATEAYLGTARRRVSARRHARLLDYRAHDGCASRVWLRVEVKADCTLRAGFAVRGGRPPPLAGGGFEVASLAPSDDAQVYETLEDSQLTPDHARFALYDWGVRDLALEAGATSAALVHAHPGLRRGDVLVLVPLSAPEPGAAPPKCVVRLSERPRLREDPLTGIQITEITWAPEDAPTEAIPITRVAGGRTWRGLAEAWGNIVPAEAGRSVVEGAARTPSSGWTTPGVDDDSAPPAGLDLLRQDLICAVPYDPAVARERPAADFARLSPLDARPCVQLMEEHGGAVWTPAPDLIGLDRYARRFVVETEDEGATRLRFGDDQNGARPSPDAALRARYRVGRMGGEAAAGLLGLWDPRPEDEAVIGVSNPLPTMGGRARAPLEEIRRDAPGAFRLQQRCVVAEDYAAAVLEHPAVQDAMAYEQWTGRAATVRVRVSPMGGGPPSPALLVELRERLEGRRLIGVELEVGPPRFAPLEIGLQLSVASPYPPTQVRQRVTAAVRSLLGAPAMRFGSAVELGPILALAMADVGVADVRATAFGRRGQAAAAGSGGGRIEIGPQEIAQGDDISTPAGRGRLTIEAEPAR